MLPGSNNRDLLHFTLLLRESKYFFNELPPSLKAVANCGKLLRKAAWSLHNVFCRQEKGIFACGWWATLIFLQSLKPFLKQNIPHLDFQYFMTNCALNLFESHISSSWDHREPLIKRMKNLLTLGASYHFIQICSAALQTNPKTNRLTPLKSDPIFLLILWNDLYQISYNSRTRYGIQSQNGEPQKK